MSINKNVVVQGKAIKLELDGSGSLSNSFGKLNLEKTKLSVTLWTIRLEYTSLPDWLKRYQWWKTLTS